MAPDDLAVGQLVTVLDWYSNSAKAEQGQPPSSFFDLYYGGGRSTPPPQRREFFGAVLEVVAINLPYVVVRQQPHARTTMLDTRLCELMRIKPEFAAAVVQMYEELHRTKKALSGKMATPSYQDLLKQYMDLGSMGTIFKVGKPFTASDILERMRPVAEDDDPLTDDEDPDDE